MTVTAWSGPTQFQTQPAQDTVLGPWNFQPPVATPNAAGALIKLSVGQDGAFEDTTGLQIQLSRTAGFGVIDQTLTLTEGADYSNADENASIQAINLNPSTTYFVRARAIF